MNEYIFALIIVLALIIVFINIRSRSKQNEEGLDGRLEPELIQNMQTLSILNLPTTKYDSVFAEDTVTNFDALDTTGLDTVVGVAGGDAPQLSDVSVESPEYKRQMKSLIDHMLKIGHKRKIINDYINHIKDKNLSPQLILMQLKNDPHAPPANIS